MKRFAVMLVLGTVALLAAQGAANQTASQLSAEAQKAVADKDYARGAALYMEATKKDPTRLFDWYNGACAFSLIGKKEEAFRCLNELVARGFSSRDLLKNDSDFDAIRSDRRWKEVESKIDANYWKSYDQRGSQAYWDGPALRTPFRENLPLDERIGGLSKLWSEVKYNSSALDFKGNVDWDKMYVEALPRVRAAESALDYYSVLRRCLAGVGDATSYLAPPPEVARKIGYAPVRVRSIDGRLFVVGAAENAKQAGVAIGSEIVAVDGMPTARFIERNVSPLVNAANLRNLRAQSYSDLFSEGAVGSPIELTLASGSGTRKVRLQRIGKEAWEKALNYGSYEFRMLPGNIAYVAMRSLADLKARTAFMTDWPKYEKAASMIVDLRENASGDTNIGLPFESVFLKAPIYFYQWSKLQYTPDERLYAKRRSAIGPSVVTSMWSRVPNHWEKPVALLVGPRTGQVAEIFASAFINAHRGPVLGETTAGSTGYCSFTVNLPGGFELHLAVDRLRMPNGQTFESVGLAPIIPVTQTMAEFRAGKDTVLERAIAELRQGAKS